MIGGEVASRYLNCHDILVGEVPNANGALNSMRCGYMRRANVGALAWLCRASVTHKHHPIQVCESNYVL